METSKIPDLSEIAGWPITQIHDWQTRLRNELAFLRGDAAIGGPAREAQRQALVQALNAIDARLRN